MKISKPLVISFFILAFVALGILKPVESLISSALMKLSNLSTYSKVETDRQDQFANEAVIKKLEQENSSLRNALSIKNSNRFKSVGAYVSGRSNNFVMRNLKIDKGSDDGIESDQVVLADGVVIGKIKSTTPSSSLVVLADDQSFRLEVEFSGNRGIMKGLINGSIIDRVLPDADISKNDLVVTVAQSNKIPAGLPVGRIVSVLDTPEESFRQVQVAGYKDAWRTSVVQVVIDER